MMKLSEVMAARNTGEYTDENGITWKFQRTPMVKMAEIRALSTPEKKFNPETKKFEDQPLDVDKFRALKVAYAVIEPEIDGETLQEKAQRVSELLTQLELNRLFEASLILDDLDLSKKVEEAAKN